MLIVVISVKCCFASCKQHWVLDSNCFGFGVGLKMLELSLICACTLKKILLLTRDFVLILDDFGWKFIHLVTRISLFICEYFRASRDWPDNTNASFESTRTKGEACYIQGNLSWWWRREILHVIPSVCFLTIEYI